MVSQILLSLDRTTEEIIIGRYISISPIVYHQVVQILEDGQLFI